MEVLDPYVWREWPQILNETFQLTWTLAHFWTFDKGRLSEKEITATKYNGLPHICIGGHKDALPSCFSWNTIWCRWGIRYSVILPYVYSALHSGSCWDGQQGVSDDSSGGRWSFLVGWQFALSPAAASGNTVGPGRHHSISTVGRQRRWQPQRVFCVRRAAAEGGFRRRVPCCFPRCRPGHRQLATARRLQLQHREARLHTIQTFIRLPSTCFVLLCKLHLTQ